MKMIYNYKIDQFLINAINEDITNIDITSDVVLSDELKDVAFMTAKQDGVIAGLDVAKRVFELIDSSIVFEALISDGDTVVVGQDILKISGKTKSLLKAERIALNLLQRMSGIATAASMYAKVVEGLDVRVVDTRKTTPGLRYLEKYAVKMGGCHNHRYNLSDAVMIKDNHIAAVGSIENAISIARANIPHTTKIEIEVKNLEELKEALDSKADIIMLDNMDVPTMEKAVEINSGQAILEASGNITLETLRSVAESGVDVISVGALTHSVMALDISMNIR